MNQAKLDAILAEYGRLRGETYNVDVRSDKILTVSLSVIVLIAAYGIKEQIRQVFIAIPFLIFGIAFYVLTYFYGMMVRHGYMIALESEANNIIGKNVLIWEEHLCNTYLRLHNSECSFGFSIIVVGLALIIIIYSYWQIYISYSIATFLILAIILLALTLLLIIAVKAIARVSSKCENKAKKLMQKQN